MFPELEAYIARLTASFKEIDPDRQQLLDSVAAYIRKKMEAREPVRLNFICTHNSRRSHLAQIWAQVAAHHYGLENIETYSGGTEATAFNPNAVAAIERAGFRVENTGGTNPRYELRFGDDIPSLTCFSKTYDDPVNPTSGFAAIMTCSHADEHGPFIPGAEFCASVTYRDPKEADGTPHQAQTYDERCFQIATEMLFVMSRVAG